MTAPASPLHIGMLAQVAVLQRLAGTVHTVFPKAEFLLATVPVDSSASRNESMFWSKTDAQTFCLAGLKPLSCCNASYNHEKDIEIPQKD